jgi:hypothetical protein
MAVNERVKRRKSRRRSRSRTSRSRSSTSRTDTTDTDSGASSPPRFALACPGGQQLNEATCRCFAV